MVGWQKQLTRHGYPQTQGMQRDQVNLSPPRHRSVLTLVFPIGLVAVVVANAVWVSFSAGRRDDKLDNVVDAVKEIKTEMYRRSDAEALNVKLDYLERRVTVLEAARQHHVDVVTAKVEKQEEDLLTRAQHWLTGKSH
jgi:glycine cleavage system protein P-like pyridoxal-binding family